MAAPALDKTQPTAAYVPPEERKKTIWTSFLSFIWDNDTHLKSPEERKLLFKLDCVMLPCLCLGFFCKYLDQSNLANAYVSGLQESLGWYGNQYTYAGSLYTAAYAIMQVPSTLIVQRVRPSYWLAFCEICWAAFTFAQAGAHSTGTMYALRFFVGLFESAFFPVGLYLLGSWYTPTELAKRTAIFHFTAPAGTAFSGYLQAAVYTTLSGKGGLEGWRWLYIICGVITLPCGVLVFFILPNYPKDGLKRWYFTDAEFELAQERMARVGRIQTSGLMSVPVLKRIFSKWHVYLLPLTYILFGMGCQDGSYMAIYLKSTKLYSVQMINILPTFLSIIQFVTVLLWGFLSDYTGSRFLWCIIPTVFSFLPTGILAAWPASVQLKEAAFFMSGAQFITAIIYSWWNEICGSDPFERALVISLSNGLQYAFNAWIPLLVFKQTESPSFRKGFPTTFAFVVAGAIMQVIVYLMHRRDLRREALSRTTEEESADQDISKEKVEKDTEIVPTISH